ncbi:hypothetical protein FKP32DRAFT_1456549 [Trametes sanguinea]|nr:hypothetical protein FKP32DRAFT_1456549 [Trametes sanguinea]
MSIKPSMHISQVTPEHVFPKDNPSADDLRRQNALLAIANGTVQLGDGTFAKYALHGLSSDIRATSKMLDCISTILTVANPPFDTAVIGRTDPDGATIVCASNESRERGQAQTVICKVPIDPVEGKRLLDKWSTISELLESESFSTHVSQVGSIMAYIWSLDMPQRLDEGGPVPYDIPRRFALFMTRRTRSRIVARIHHAKNTWGDWPFKIMRTWYETYGRYVTPFTVRFATIQPALVNTLARHNLQPEPDQPKCRNLSSSNILNWMDVLQELIDEILEAFGDTTVAASKEQTIRAHSAIAQLNWLLRSTLHKALREHGVSVPLMTAHRGCLKREELANRRGDVERGERFQGHATDTEDLDHAAAFRWQSPEDGVNHLWRYLEAIVAWFRAPVALVEHKATFRKLNVFIVDSVPGVDIRVEDVQDFFERYESVLTKTTAAADESEWKIILDNLDTVKANCHLHPEHHDPDVAASEHINRISTIHPEATLMVLAWACYKGVVGMVSLDSDVELNDVFPLGGEIVIGTSRQCCWLCYDIQAALSDFDRYERRVLFRLPGTHPTILPWLPPPGLPDQELRITRNRLFEILHQRLCLPEMGDGLLRSVLHLDEM